MSKEMVLYSTNMSIYGTSSGIALNYKNVPYNMVPPPGGYSSLEYRMIVPTGKIPALVHDDFILSESAVILEYIEEAFNGLDLLPSLVVKGDPKKNAIVRHTHRVHDNLYLESALRVLFAHMDPTNRQISFVNENFAKFHTQLADLERLCDDAAGPFFVGSQFTFIDCVLPCTLNMADMHNHIFSTKVDFLNYLKLAELQERLKAHPAVLPVFESQGAALQV